MKEISAVKVAPSTIKDNGAVKLGFTTPAFPRVRAELVAVADNGKVRIGFTAPAFPARAR